MYRTLALAKNQFVTRKTDIPQDSMFETEIQSRISETINPLSTQELQAMDVRSGIWGKISDKYIAAMKVWFEYNPDDIEEKVGKELHDFHRKVRFKKIFDRALRDALLYTKGGFIEIVFPDDGAAEDSVFEYDNEGNRKIPAALNKKSFRLAYIDAATIEDIKYYTDRKKDGKNYGKIKYYLQKVQTHEVKIHPDRIIHIDLMGPRKSLAERLYPIIRPLQNILTGCGEIIYRKGNPFLEVILKTWDEERVNKVREGLRDLNTRQEFIHDENASMTVPDIGGRALNPEPYANIEWEGLAAGSSIPKTLLFGSGAGTISTSDINMQDWFQSAASFQEDLEDVIEDVDQLYWECVHGEKLEKWGIEWNELYQEDEERKAKVRLAHAQADSLLLQAGLSPNLIDKNREDYGIEPLFGEEYHQDVEPEATLKAVMTPGELRANLALLLRNYREEVLKTIKPEFDKTSQ